MAQASPKVVQLEAKVVRGPNAERRAATRAKILDAALACLLEHGYSGTTTLMVQHRAGVSRGSLLHQFPTKAALMVSVLHRITRQTDRAYTTRMATSRDDRHRWELLVDVLWEELSKPTGFVRIQIMVAAYSEPEMMDRIGPYNAEMDKSYRDRIWGLAQRLGVKDRDGVDAAVSVFSAAVRGLALDLFYPRPTLDIDAALDLIRRNHMAALDRLLAPRP